MATIKDIAKLANVSQATVSNVLNGRGNVSSEKMKLVHEAAETLGYVINAQAKQLRKDSALSNIIAIILPNVNDTIYSVFYEGARKNLEEKGYNVLLFITNDSIYEETKIVNYAAELRVSGIITISCSINNPTLYTPITSNGGYVVHAYREGVQMRAFAGFDFFAIGKKIGEYICSCNYRNVGILSESKYFPSANSFHKGITAAAKEHSAAKEHTAADEISFQYEDTDIQTSSLVAFDFFKNGSSPDVIILTNSFYLKDVQLAAAISATDKIPDIIMIDNTALAAKTPGVKRYCLDYTRLGTAASEIILEGLKNKVLPEQCLILQPLGFYEDFPVPLYQTASGRGKSLKLLIASGESTNALKRILPDFTHQTGIDVNVKEISTDDIYSRTVSAGTTGEFDLVRINMSCMSAFDPDMFYRFEEEEFSALTNGMFPRVVNDFTQIKAQKTAIPFDIGTEMLVYRKDLFENSMQKRMYYERFGEHLKIPASFEDFRKIVQFFNQTQNPNSPVRSGSTVNIDCGSELFSNFILRFLNYSEQLSFPFTDEALCRQCLTSVLKNLQECATSSLPIFNQPWVGSSLTSFIHGQTAAEIIFLNYASSIIHLRRSTYGGQIGYAPIPGGRSYITGGALSIYKKSPNVEEARKFIHWISNSAQAELFTLCGGLSPHAHVYDSSLITTKYPWYHHLPETINSGYGRSFWNSINPEGMKSQLIPILRDICLGYVNSEFVSGQVYDIFKTFTEP